MDHELKIFKNKKVDVLILGCTHYSYFKKEISDYFDNKVQVIDSIKGVANRVIDLMTDDVNSFKNERILFISNVKNGIKEKYERINTKYKLFNKIKIKDMSCQKV